MSIIIRLQNLPWAADSMDIRRYFSGLSIPEGGVHIVGGEMGDAFIAFSTDEDARLAMAKDGGKIHEMQIKLLLSSRTEMMRVIEKARQLNLALQAQALPIPQPIVQTLPISAQQSPLRTSVQPLEDDRRRGHSPHRRNSRDKSPGRGDRRRSPDSRRSSSKRERSRSPSRSSRSSNRDTDRRDRTKRDDRRHDDSRYRDDRHSGRETSREPKKYSSEADSRQGRAGPPTETFRESSNHRYDESVPTVSSYSYDGGSLTAENMKGPQTVSSYSYDSALTAESMKGLPPAFFPQTMNQIHPSDPFAVKQMTPVTINSSASSVYMQQSMAYSAVPYGQTVPVSKESSAIAVPEQTNRRSRFESDFPQTQDPYFTATNPSAKASIPEVPYNDKMPAPHDFHSSSRDAWSPKHENNWVQKRSGLLDPPTSKNGDYGHQVIPMDIEASPPSEMMQGKITFSHTDQYLASRIMPPRGSDVHPDKQWPLSPSSSVVITGLPPDARIEEVQDMFRNIPISPSNICIEANAQGVEKAFIRFSKATEFQDALSVQPRYIRNYRCDIIPCPDAAFEAAAAAPKAIKPRPKPRPNESDLVVQLRGLPYSCKESEIERFFEGLKIVNIAVELSSEGRSVGIAFVQFATEKDFRMGLTMNGKMIGHRFITISIASHDHITAARGSDISKIQQAKIPQEMVNNFDSPHSNDVVPPTAPASVQLPVLAQPTNFCLSITGMPKTVTNQDIVEFFSNLDIIIRAIHLMLDANKIPTGEAYVEFGTKRDATIALSRNNMPLLGNRVFLCPISYQDMKAILDGPKAIPPPPAPGPLLKTPIMASPEAPRRPLIDVPPSNEDFNSPHHDCPPHDRPHFDGPGPNQSHYKHPEGEQPHFRHAREESFSHKQGERSHSEFPRAERPLPDFPRGDRPHLDHPRGDKPHPDHSRGERPRSDFPRGERPHPDHPRGERPPVDFSRGERSRSDHAYGERPPADYPRGERPTDFVRGERQHSDNPRGERPHPDHPRGDRIPPDFPRGERPHSDYPRDERPHPDYPHGERPQADFPRGERSRPDFPPRSEYNHGDGPSAEFHGERPPRGLRGERPRMGFPRPHLDFPHRGERPRFDPRFRGSRPPHMERGMRPPFSRMRGPFPNRPGGPPPEHSSPAGFGSPGCVVSINNLHYDAGLEELSDFFKDYMLTKDNIIRRFDESGRATAEARVAFQCPADAQRAVRELNRKTIMGRSLFLTLL